LAQFYYDRGNARALLGRSNDAIADLKRLCLSHAAHPMPMFFYRFRQFLVAEAGAG